MKRNTRDTTHGLADRLLTRGAVLERTAYGVSTLYRHMSEGRFPRPFRLGGGKSVRWSEREVEQALSLLPRSNGARGGRAA